jgi:hypothetical protein
MYPDPKANPFNHGDASILEHNLRVEHGVRAGPPGTLQTMFAVVGIVIGFALLVLPGWLMLRQVRAWRAGQRRTPGPAAILGALAIWIGAGVAIWTLTPYSILAIAVAAFGLVPSLLVAARDRSV